MIFSNKNKNAFLSRRRIPLATLLYEQFIHLTQITLRPQHIAFEQLAARLSVFFRFTSWFDTIRRSDSRLSGPAAWPDLRFLGSFRIPAVEIPNSSMKGFGLWVPAWAVSWSLVSHVLQLHRAQSG